MSKPISLSFPEKSASELASRLGMSEARKNRIFAIVAETARKTGSGLWATKARAKASKNGRLSSRSGRRSNAKAAR